jgi:TonB family protein
LILTPMVIADTPACNTPNKTVTLTQAITPDYPDSAKDLGLGHLVILVAVTVDGDGKVIDARIQRTSYNMALDRSALLAAHFSSYSPMIQNCQATTGSTIFRADMNPQAVYLGARCAQPNRLPVQIRAADAAPPDSVRTLTSPVTVLVLVTIGLGGDVADAQLILSSNDSAIDDAVLATARGSAYAPALFDCRPVLSTYVVRETFGPH